MSFEPTYKELKQAKQEESPEAFTRFEPTYKELKLCLPTYLSSGYPRFEPTYKELKLKKKILDFLENTVVLSLPIRN